MRTVQAWAPEQVPQAVPGGPVRARRWHVVGAAGHPAAALLAGFPSGSGTAGQSTAGQSTAGQSTAGQSTAGQGTAGQGTIWQGTAGQGTAILLGSEYGDGDNARLTEGVRAAVRRGGRLVLLHLGAGGVSLLRAAMGENRTLRGVAVELPSAPSAAALRTAAALAGGDLSTPDELRVAQDGRITVTGWRPVPLPDPRPPGPGRGGLALITGGLGGLGIRAAALLAHHDGLHPVLVDRRDPADLPGATRRYLRCLADGPTGVTVRRADLTDPRAAAAALAGLPGPVVTFVHGAGVMCHGPAGRYTPESLAEAQAVKVTGLAHVLAAVDPRHLRSLVVLGSMLAEQPPHPLGGYALANELLRRAVPRLTAHLSGTAVVTAQWSIWAGAGMAHDLAVLPQARAMGLVPVSLRPGLDALRRLTGGGVTGPLLLLGANRPDPADALGPTVPGQGRNREGLGRNREEGRRHGHAYRLRGWGDLG